MNKIFKQNADQLILDLSSETNPTFLSLRKLQRRFAKDHEQSFFTNDELIESYHKLVASKTIIKREDLERLLTLKNTRSNSGIVVVSVLTKPYPCPGKCIYCPSQPDVPKSYMDNEPAVMRAIMCSYHPYTQMKARLDALKATGHKTSKINIRIIGGTWSYYTPQYQAWFVKQLFKAANQNLSVEPSTPRSLRLEEQAGSEFRTCPSGRRVQNSVSALEQLQKENETAKHRIVEISIETRQDYIDIKEILRLRKFGVTKVELGVQSIYDDVLKLNKRGNDNISTIHATKLLKDAGFKVAYQIMLNLPGSDYQRDFEMFKILFTDPRYQPDHLKIYPLALVKEAEIYKLYKEGRFKPYTEKELTKLICKIKTIIPPYCRIERVIRDIPAASIVEGGAKISNLRQIVAEKMKENGTFCQCIRCREIRSGFDPRQSYQLKRYEYDASLGKEIFLSLETDQGKILSFLRLRFPSNDTMEVLRGSCIVREIHTYGPQLDIGEKSTSAAQHQGLGRKLMIEAEKIAKEEFGLKKLSVISGIGVREYFKKLNYHLENTYMVKNL